MNAFVHRRYAVIFGAVAILLAGCGGSQPPLGTPSQAEAKRDSAPQQAFGVLHEFGGAGDGTNPSAALIDVGGTLYGTTSKGGANGYGTVFSIGPSGAETVLHSFGSGQDGAQPTSALLDVNGTLYGTTSAGGATNNGGTVFSITPSGTEKVLHSFNFAGGGGAAPVAGLIDEGGTLYGTTSVGGKGAGTVFSITPAGTYNVLHQFGKGHDGSNPQAPLLYFKGSFYGTTVYGGTFGSGTVFRVSKSGNEVILHDFSGEGALPTAGLIAMKGMLYGTTSQGGTYYGYGIVFSLSMTGSTEHVLHNFRTSDGIHPLAALTNVNGVLYGTTSQGGPDGGGTIFKLVNLYQYTVLHDFGNESGDNPEAALIEVDHALYGTTYGGVPNNVGNVFSLKR
jgi:uncharacterized repeat protein (TIGR03803 family)